MSSQHPANPRPPGEWLQSIQEATETQPDTPLTATSNDEGPSAAAAAISGRLAAQPREVYSSSGDGDDDDIDSSSSSFQEPHSSQSVPMEASSSRTRIKGKKKMKKQHTLKSAISSELYRQWDQSAIDEKDEDRKSESTLSRSTSSHAQLPIAAPFEPQRDATVRDSHLSNAPPAPWKHMPHGSSYPTFPPSDSRDSHTGAVSLPPHYAFELHSLLNLFFANLPGSKHRL